VDLDHSSYGYQVHGNPDLKPERSVGGTLSVDWEPVPTLTVSGSAFWNQLWDMIQYKFSSAGSLTLADYANTAHAVSAGAEAAVTWSPIRFLTLGVGYTFTHARDLDTGYEFEGQPEHRVVGQLRVRVREWGLTGFLRAAWTSLRPLVDGQDVPVGRSAYGYDPRYLLLDARVAWRFLTFFEVFVAGNNLTGEVTNQSLPLPPRSFTGGLSFTY
jgi:outer membrane receptor for ferrienterochelin and colicins